MSGLQPFEIPDLPPEGLNKLADYLVKMAEQVRSHATHAQGTAQNSERRREQFSSAKAAYKQLGYIVAQQIEAGSPYNIAIELTAKATGYDADNVKFSYTLYQRQRREDRATVIKWLKSKGWTDMAIGEIVDLHEGSVNRIRHK